MLSHGLYLKTGEILLKRLENKFHFNMSNEERWDLVENTLKDVAYKSGDGQIKDIYDNHA